MGRAEKKQLQKETAENKAAYAGLEGQTLAELQGIPTDYTEEQKGAIRRRRMEGLDTGYDIAGEEAGRRFARTGATAGYGELVNELTRERSREKSRAGAELEVDFADEPLRRRLMRAGILLPLTQTRAGLYGSGLEGITRLGANNGPSWWQSILGAGSQIGAAWLSNRDNKPKPTSSSG